MAKNQKNEYDEYVFGWRVRSTGRFLSKIFSWLLGAFVIGLLTSIFFLLLNAPHLSQPMARVLFFIFFFLGIASNLFRDIVNGIEYRMTQNALVQVHPFCGFNKINSLIGSNTYPFRTEYFYIPWKNIKDIKDKTGKIQLIEKETDSMIDIQIDRVLNYFGYDNDRFFETP
ncbi:MAG: hypothetical protein U5R06_18375 [candidate division KSB1 bacterium]|nr:hypothetical protein [candidate division KSB1 bacterium]